MENKISISLDQLKRLLDQQKRIVASHIAGNSGTYNPETTESVYKVMAIDKEKMIDLGIRSSYPDDFETLTKYL